MRKAKADIVLLLFFTLVSFQAAEAKAGEDSAAGGKVYDTLAVYWENDLFGGTDHDYTNGLRFTWSTPYRLDADDPRLPGWSRFWLALLPKGGEGVRRAASFSVGQSIYTPSDMGRAEPDPNDRPYAGYSYLAASIHRRYDRVKTSWELQLGIVGPLSFGEEFQNLSHDLVGNGRAQGWDNQLHNEPGLELIGERYWRLLHPAGESGFGFDLVPHLGGRLGNILTSVNLGGELRLGWNLPPTFGTCPIRGGCESYSAFNDESSRPAGMGFRGCHFFVGVDGRAVFRDIFLDGNTFRGSPSVDKEPLVADLLVGVVLRYDSWTATYCYVYRTKEFKTQSKPQLFGSLGLAWAY